MRPGMGRGLVVGCVVGSAWVTGMVVAGFGERSKNFVIGFLVWGCGGGAGGCDFALCAEGWNESRIPAWFGRKRKGGLGRVPRGAGARTCLTDLNSFIVSLWSNAPDVESIRV